MMFAPTTERSVGVRSLYAALYTLLALGAVTMIAPFLIMLSGSVEPRAGGAEPTFFPTYVVDRQALWERYLETKYHADERYLQMAYNSPGLTFSKTAPLLEPAEEDTRNLELWREFLADSQPPEELFAVGFLRRTPRMPSTNGFLFADWLLARHGSLEGINKAISGDYTRLSRVRPPLIRIDGAPLPDTPIVRSFLEFAREVPASRKFAWDAGGYFRSDILPRLVGHKIEAYNQKFGTAYSSYAEVPFPATAPEIGREPWFFYVSQMLRPDFVRLTPAGQGRQEASGMPKADFIRLAAVPEDLEVVSLDTLFEKWAESRGVSGARIPQQALDRAAFEEEAGFWIKEYLTINYRLVSAEILVHGRAILNTVILVVLSVVGALIVNPLAAYALSRYKLRTSFQILLFFLATIAFPGEVTMIPVFLQLKELGLLNTFGALVLPGLASGFSIFLLKGFFDSLPRELYEAAELDGASEWVTFWNITMNLSKPILAVIALSTFVSAYGTFFYALILAPDPRMWTVMVYVFQLRMSSDPPVVYAALMLTAIPTLVIFITCQNIILRGIVVPSDK